ncbi:MAG TPA: hypothetical protein PKZ43_04980 [Bacteroidales bacterium]|nr:hypothetical protein [Bacteroidales bacterium]HQI45440.1 hypothetical protein [Bacteroidales bacterium]
MENKTTAIRSKILKGIELAFCRLIEKKSKENGDLIYCKDGRIFRIKAKDLLK